MIHNTSLYVNCAHCVIKKVLKNTSLRQNKNVLENIPRRSTKRGIWMTLTMKEKKSVRNVPVWRTFLSAGRKRTPVVDVCVHDRPRVIYPPHLHPGIRAVLDFVLFSRLIRPKYALYAVSVRRTEGLPPASFRFHLAMDTLAFG